MGVLCASKYGGYTLNSKKLVDATQKVKTMLAIVLAILLTLSVLSAISANAAAPFISAETVGGETAYKVTGGSNDGTFKPSQCTSSIFGGFALKLIYLSYGGLFDVLSNSNVFTLNNIQEIESGGSSIWGLYGSLYKSVSAAGIGLALIWTLLSMIEKMSDGRMTEELVISLFAKFILAAFIISYGQELCISLLNLSNEIVDAFKRAIDTWASSKTAETAALATEAGTKMEAIVGGNIFASCGYIIESLIPATAMLVCWVLACVQLISRILELGIRTAFMPIGVADFMTHGTHSPGMRYIKAYAGCACQGAALYVILISGVTLMNSSNVFAMFGGSSTPDLSAATAATGKVVISIVVAITMLGLMKRVDHILKEVFQ